MCLCVCVCVIVNVLYKIEAVKLQHNRLVKMLLCPSGVYIIVNIELYMFVTESDGTEQSVDSDEEETCKTADSSMPSTPDMVSIVQADWFSLLDILIFYIFCFVLMSY